MNKHFLLITCCILCVVVLIICMADKKKYPPIDEYNNDVFTKELYEKITKIAIDKEPELIHYKEDKQSIHDAFALLASLKLSDFVSNEELYGCIAFRIYIRDHKEPYYVGFGNNNITFQDNVYAYDKEILQELIDIIKY